MNVLLLIAGNFMEPSAILLIMGGILFEIAKTLGIDPIHLGVTSGITGKSMSWAVKACAPWLLLMLLFLIIITYVPEISLWLPNKMYG